MKKAILSIDDDEDLLRLVRRHLEKAGYEAHVEKDSKEGIKKSIQLKPQIILLDVEMPKPDGFECLQTLRNSKECKHVPIIMLTAKGATDFILKAQSLNVTDYLIKPFEVEDLLKIIGLYI